MKIPPYFKQEHSNTCSLAILRMVLASKGVHISEEDLLLKVEKDYGKKFKNIWNPTIAKLAGEYGLKTIMYALWPLFKKDLLKKALKAYRNNPDKFNISKYENKNDKDMLPEPVPLAYKEMFKAIKLGCKTIYGSITERRLKNLISKGNFVQISINLRKMYPDKKGFHSLLLYRLEDNKILYHDPYYGKSLITTFNKLTKASTHTGAAIVHTPS